MGARVFIDTNILLRALMPALTHHQRAEALLQRLWTAGDELWISRQVIREYLVQAAHPSTFIPPLTVQEVSRQVAAILALFSVADDTAEVTARLLGLLAEYPTRGKQIHDANIVATMLVYGIETLATLNTGDMERFAPRIRLITLDEEPA